MSDPITHRGAGILFVTAQGKALFLKRGPGGDAPGAWCFPGGTTEGDETAEQTALREAEEEVGSIPAGKRVVHTRSITPIETINAAVTATAAPTQDKVDFTTFIQHVPQEFTPTLNGEHTGWAWAAINEPPAPLHPGCSVALSRLNWDELGVARAMAAGQLTSPQLYGNVHLFDMRITGTGVAYRGAKHDDKGNQITPEEFVYRRPENYLTDEFLQRCHGLAVIMMHPAKALLNSKEHGARVVGAMMLPYIKGDEVWGIAKIYDDDAIKMMLASQMSTSPAVLLGNGDQKLKTEDGTDLHIEGKPSLLDHLAICERGVWDKGGAPSGVRTDNQTGDTTMELTKEQLEALNKQVASAVAAALPGLIPTIVTAVRADDSGGGQKLDKVLSAIDAFCGKMDTFEKKMDSHGKRMDAIEEKEKKDSDKDDIKKMDGESDEDFKKRKDAAEEMIAADKRKDAEEKEAKEKADAEEKEKVEKEKADSARSDTDRLVAATTDIAKRLINVEKSMPKQLSDADLNEFSTVQARMDDVYSGFGKRAPRPLGGEEILPYRRRMLNELKVHSPACKEIDVLAIADSVTLGVIETMILRDAALAALNPKDLRDDELREIVRQDAVTGGRTIEFRGKHSFVRSMTPIASRVTGAFGVRKEA